MKRILAAILTAAVAFTCITAPVQKANASVYKEEDGYKYYESEISYYTDENGNQYYTILSVSEITGEAGDYIGDVVYDKDGNVIYKKINDEVLVDKRNPDKDKAPAEKNLKAKVIRYDEYGVIEKSKDVVEGFTTKLKCLSMPYYKEISGGVAWSSSNKSVATVSKDGTVKAKKPGKVTITATVNQDGQKFTKELKVVKNQYRAVDVYAGMYKRTDTVSYDKKGNLVWKMTFKNLSKRQTNYRQRCSLYNDNKKIKIVYWNVTVSRGKTRTKTVVINKSKIGGKVFDLTKYWNAGAMVQ